MKWEYGVLISESVDSICRNSVDMQYIMLIQKKFSKSPKQLSYKPLITLLFIFECFHDEQHTQWR